uniref:Agenet domain-containing protein n=1 Tax=Cannabis sativa TaxID=3483 RepID=A0A803QDZ2_CANSA
MVSDKGEEEDRRGNSTLNALKAIERIWGFRGSLTRPCIHRPLLSGHRYPFSGQDEDRCYHILYVEYGSPHPVENPLREIVNANNVRQLLRAEQLVFNAGDDVEFFFRNRWFRGVVVSMNEEKLRYTVRLHDSTRSIANVCLHRNLRLHREWNNGAWNPPLPKERTKRTIPIGKDPLKVKEKSMKVKISALIKDNSLERCSKTLKNIVKEDIFKDEYVV